MRKIKKLVLPAIFVFTVISTQAAPDSVSVDTIIDYQDWGWEVLVVKNNFITLGIIPSIGGRVLQYDLGVDTFMIINDDLLGQLFDPEDNIYGPWAGSWGYGGYKTWPAPQNDWPGTWPPPPYMAWGNYEYEVFQTSKDSIVIWMKGETEGYQAPDLRFDRYITVYANSTRVKVTTVLFNDATSAQEWAVWDVTQTIVQHENLEDYSNFSSYFPAESSNDYWGSGFSISEVLPGVYQAKFVGSTGKTFAVASDGWACYTDERDRQTYAKVFDIVEGADYSDGGAMVHLYSAGGSEYVEVEVLGPLGAISPGDSIVFIEDWYATRTGGPFYHVGHEGIVIEHLDYIEATQHLTGEFAAFSEGEFHIIYLDESDLQIGSGPVFQTIPTDKLVVDQTETLPGNTRYIEIQAFNYSDNRIGVLDRLDLENPPDAIEEVINGITAKIYPNPADDLLTIQLSEKINNNCTVVVRSVTGQVLISGVSNMHQSSTTLSVENLQSGLYIVEITGVDFIITKQVMIQ